MYISIVESSALTHEHEIKHKNWNSIINANSTPDVQPEIL